MSTSTSDLVASVTEQVLDAVAQVQDLTLDAVRAAVETVGPLVSGLPQAPFADQLPTAEQVIDAGFALAGQLLNRQRTFAQDLAGILGGLRPSDGASAN